MAQYFGKRLVDTRLLLTGSFYPSKIKLNVNHKNDQEKSQKGQLV